MIYDRPNDPNAGRLIESLRYLGYGNYEAIADIVDNSFDAEANQIKIRAFNNDGKPEIWIADNGIGMDWVTLDQAMRLGSDTTRNVESDLGKFGMGMVTASLSMAKRCHVITCGSEGFLSTAWDVDEIVTKNAFVKHLDKATAKEEKLFRDGVGETPTGTLVVLSKIDNLSNKNMSSFASNLKHHLGRIHRYFIASGKSDVIPSGKSIVINDERILPIDPLQLAAGGTEIVMDELFPVSVNGNSDEMRENVRVRIALVPDVPASELDIARSMRAQGFYVMRNQREVMDAVTLNFFSKHNDFNRMRGEIFFPGILDKLVGIEFTKRQVNFHQSLFDQLANTLKPTCTSIKRMEANKKKTETGPVQKELHGQSVKSIAEKDKLLLKPKARPEKRSSPLNESDKRIGPKTDPSGERKKLTRTQELEDKLNCVIREERMGPNGQIYECDLIGKKIILRYNVEHPFYQRFIVDNLHDGRMVKVADFLIYSMASAELKLHDDGDLDAVNNFKAIMSANLRTLLN